MITQCAPSREGERCGESSQGVAFPKHLTISNTPIDVRDTPLGKRIGSKRPAAIDLRLGGMGVNGGQVFVANQISCGIIGTQAAGMLAALCRELALGVGLEPLIVERQGSRGALTVAIKNGVPGAHDLDVQREPPLTISELAGLVKRAASLPTTAFVGPMQMQEATMQFHGLVASLTSHRALMVHPSLLSDPRLFSRVGQVYGFVQMNHAEACVLDKSTKDIAKLACRVRYLLGEETEFAITCGDRRGLLWADHRWLWIDPPSVRRVVSDIGAGDVWGSAFVLGRWHFDATVKDAAEYAREVAGAWISEQPLPRFRP